MPQNSSTYIIGDVRDCLAAIPDGSIDLVMTSPPFLALRSYLPADHPDKHREIGSEPDPATFLDTLLLLTAEWGRVLAPHGSICVELGDTYSGSGGAGGDYNPDGLRDGQSKFEGSNQRRGKVVDHNSGRRNPPDTWPLPKSLCGIPHLYHLSLAYGRNLLTGEESPAGRWRVRNVVAWCRPNPPVGALGDKFRPATSYMTIATRAQKRYFDLDAVRVPLVKPEAKFVRENENYDSTSNRGSLGPYDASKSAGAPPLDYWVIPTQPYSGKATTSRRVPCGPDDGGERTTSPDCPVHGGQPDLPPTGQRDGRASSPRSRTPRSDAGPAQGQLLGSEATDESPDRAGSSPSPTTGTTGPECAPAAKPRSKASNRTGLAPVTTSPGTPSEETSNHSGGTSVPPSSGEHHPGTPESRTSGVGSLGSPALRTSGDTADTGTQPESSSACTCSFHRVVTESTSHYAVYPPALCERPIKAMCPAKVCTVCGAPSERIVEQTEEYAEARARLRQGTDTPTGWDATVGNRASGFESGVARDLAQMERTRTAGWTDCGHDSWRPGVVLDPFAGSGTTLMVANELERDAIGFDLDERNASLARDRVDKFLFSDFRALPLDEFMEGAALLAPKPSL